MTPRWRIRAVAVLPVVFLEAQFEVLITAFALVSGPPQALGVVHARSLDLLVPEWFSQVYGVALTLAGLSLLVGLRRGGMNPPTAAGLRLTACAVAVYGVAVVVVLGLAGLITAALFFSVASLSALRAFTITTSRRFKAEVLAEADR